MYQYSLSSLDKYLNHPIECFYYIKFVSDKKGIEFMLTRQASEENNHKVLQAGNQLKDQGINKLEELQTKVRESGYEDVYKTLPLLTFLLENIQESTKWVSCDLKS